MDNDCRDYSIVVILHNQDIVGPYFKKSRDQSNPYIFLTDKILRSKF